VRRLGSEKLKIKIRIFQQIRVGRKSNPRVEAKLFIKPRVKKVQYSTRLLKARPEGKMLVKKVIADKNGFHYNLQEESFPEIGF